MKINFSKILQGISSSVDVRSIYQKDQTLFIILEETNCVLCHSDLFRLHRGPYGRPEQHLYITSPEPVEVHYYLIKPAKIIAEMNRDCRRDVHFANDTPVNFIECEDSINIPKDALCLYAVPNLKPNVKCVTNTLIKGERDITPMTREQISACFFNDLNRQITLKQQQYKSLNKNSTSFFATDYQRMSVIVITLALLFILKKCFTSKQNIKTIKENTDLENNESRYTV